jgi:hypothetical protein
MGTPVGTEASLLLALEKQSRRAGSGLRCSDLIGVWRLHQLWDKGSLVPKRVTAAILRGLFASLELQHGEDDSLWIQNSLALGGLKLSFEGTAHLRGTRPLLVFCFRTIRLTLASHLVWSLTLPDPTQRKEPFFALIACQRTQGGKRWLAARGRGGGLALWTHAEGHAL